MLPDLRSEFGLFSLQDQGYGFTDFDRPRNFKMQAEILDVAIKTALGLTPEPHYVSDTAYLVLDSLFAAPKGFEFFQRFPKEEVTQFCRLAVLSRLDRQQLPVVSPVCPDYPDVGYVLGDGVPRTAQRVLDNLIVLKEFLINRGLSFMMQMHVADIEAFEPLILQVSGETTESFLWKTNRSIIAIQERIQLMGLEKFILAGSMLSAFNGSGLDYFALKETNAREIIDHGGRKVRKTVEALAAERVRLGDFDLIGQDNHKPMAAEELANYATYGDLVDGRAVILSPDTLSPMPAYNFLRGGQKLFNPTIYLKQAKEKNYSIFME